MERASLFRRPTLLNVLGFGLWYHLGISRCAGRVVDAQLVVRTEQQSIEAPGQHGGHGMRVVRRNGRGSADRGVIVEVAQVVAARIERLTELLGETAEDVGETDVTAPVG